MKKRSLIAALMLGTIVYCCVGCYESKFVRVTGKVTYADGTPLTRGQICFDGGYYLGRSDLDKNGEYSLHIFRKNDGVPPGIYQVYITSALRFEADDTVVSVPKTPDGEEDDRYVVLKSGNIAKVVELIDLQYTNARTSGWVVEVSKKASSFDFTVYPPGEVPEDEVTEEARFQFDPQYRAKKVREYWQDKAREDEDSEGSDVEPPKPRLVRPELL
ncbi:MAG: hypothetical protein ACOX0A_09715 [Thermoguttaceae bacterium]|jgi:hypothetical protein